MADLAARLAAALGELIDAAMALADADFGNIQLLDSRGHLGIVAQRNFPSWWLDFWEREARSLGACGQALQDAGRVIVEDVVTSPIFVGRPSLDVQLRAGVRAVHSIPIVGRDGRCLGILSIHYRQPRRPGDKEMRVLDLLAAHAGTLADGARDVALLRANELQLSQALALQDAATLGAEVLIATIDREHRYTYFNRRHQDELRRLTGRTTALGMRLEDVLADLPQELEQALTIWRRALAGDIDTNLIEYGEPGRHRRWYRTRHVPIRDSGGQVIGAGEVTEDVSAQVEAQQWLELQASILKRIDDGVKVVSAVDDLIVYTNPAFEAMFGYGPGELIGQRCHVLHAGSQEDAEALVGRVNEALQERGCWEGELQGRRKDGSLLWTHSIVTRQELSPWGPVWLGIRRDITERVDREAERQARDARQRDALVREVHHRLKNHLHGVLGLLSAETMARPELAAPLGDVHAQIKSVALLYGLQAAEGPGRVELCSMIERLAADAVGPVPAVFQSRDASGVVLSESAGVPLALSINELITNALKHLLVPDAARPICITLEPLSDAMCLKVRGGPARLPEGFDFDQQRGLGLGLSLLATMLPSIGTQLRFDQLGDEVCAVLVMRPPAIDSLVDIAMCSLPDKTVDKRSD